MKAIDFTCPRCCARPGRPCKGSRIPGANTLGGGWGGPPPRQRPHNERYEALRTARLTKEAEELVSADADMERMNEFASRISEEQEDSVMNEDFEAINWDAAKRLRTAVLGPIA